MKAQFVSHDFKLTPSIRAQLSSEIAHLESVISEAGPNALSLRVTLKRGADPSFTCSLSMRHGKATVLGHASSESLDSSITKAFGVIQRRLQAVRRRRVTKRRETGPAEAVA